MLFESQVDEAIADWFKSGWQKIKSSFGGIKNYVTEIWNKIKNVIATVNNQFFHAHLSGIYEPMQLTEYSASDKGYYDWHTDGGIDDKVVPRKISMVLMLSDESEYEGGYLQIKTSRNNETLEMKKGRAWFFPSYVLHRVTPITKGLRKTAVVWAGGEHWK